MNAPEPQFIMADGAITTTESGFSPYPSNDNPFVQVDLPDVGADLTEEDKVYLATKWGQLYTDSVWVYLENKYKDFMEFLASKVLRGWYLNPDL